MPVKRIYFFSGGTCFEYDPRPGADAVVRSRAASERLNGMDVDFLSSIRAAVNWGNGSVYFFSGSQYWEYDALSDTIATPKPRQISDGWPTFPDAFAAGIDAAFNSGQGTAYFFKGDQYLRYDIEKDRVDDPDPGTSPYPRKITDPNGWHGLPPSFSANLDATVNAGDGKLYFFKDTRYVRITFASRSVDVVDPPYPLSIVPAWRGMPPLIDAAVEWIQAGNASLKIVQNPTCQRADNAIGRAALMHGTFDSPGYPSLCGCAEYRQFVKGRFLINNRPFILLLANPAGGAPLPISPFQFREDGRTDESIPFYGHRAAAGQDRGKYIPDQRTGCRFEGSDIPIIGGGLGDRVEIDLEFRSVIIDVAADGEVLTERLWSVHCSGEVL
ncbi:hemopexin repeat-containing protein [Paraburkholderia caribensis]|uniref:hemopexin repeat-containing protein n=1 Tax=Paraburkholderia caribensis TaxID=75105 RepID=UPI00078E2E72|nr:hemopexin repeat-containing protein [Paraburkholderia caribensis]AMV47794.1 hypothetical protein ATN79_44820 [Paraburkholderia caribensis]